MSQVAILQNQFKLSGRTHVMCEMIYVLNELGIVPDVLSFTPAEIGADVGRYFGLEKLDYTYRQVAPLPLMRGYLWQVLAINQITRRKHSVYDLVINSNDTLYGLHGSARYLHYIHYPTPGKTPYRYTTSLPRLLYGRLLKRLIILSGRPRLNDVIYANSAFSRQAILDLHPVDPANVRVLYPPAYAEDTVQHGDRDRVQRCISIGAFIPEKHQLQQLEIAAQLPELDFVIAGSITSQRYYGTCAAYKTDHTVDNATLAPDMPYDDLQAALKASAFFIHTKENEPFGIGTVQAIAAGCIPVVHDSAGQREIVPLPELRFKTSEQAVAILRDLMAKSDVERSALRDALQAHIRQFSNRSFRQKVRSILYERPGIADGQ